MLLNIDTNSVMELDEEVQPFALSPIEIGRDKSGDGPGPDDSCKMARIPALCKVNCMLRPLTLQIRAKKRERSTRFWRGFVICVFACLAAAAAPGAEPLPRSVLYLDQDDPALAFAAGVSATFRSTIKVAGGENVAIYTENLDLIGRQAGTGRTLRFANHLRRGHRQAAISHLAFSVSCKLPERGKLDSNCIIERQTNISCQPGATSAVLLVA